MPEPSLHINNLHLRVPGLGREEARRLGEAVARELAKSPPPPNGRREIGTVAIRMPAPSNASTTTLASQIAARIRQTLE